MSILTTILLFWVGPAILVFIVFLACALVGGMSDGEDD